MEESHASLDGRWYVYGGRWRTQIDVVTWSVVFANGFACDDGGWWSMADLHVLAVVGCGRCQ